jgi:SAM-dependent MidA family methyltransferase
MNCLPNHYYILELSADLKERQRAKINSLCPEFLSRVVWLNTLPKRNFKGIILANEVLDAMPVQLFQIVNHNAYRVDVIEKRDKLTYSCTPIPENALKIPELTECLEFSNGYTSEINFNLKPWIRSLSDSLLEGVILIIDYGFPRQEYYHPDRTMGTLLCHYRHHSHTDPFLYPGLQDITAHVDFTAIAEAATNANLEILGYCEQAAFLLSCSLTEVALENTALTEKELLMQNQVIHTLTSAAEMGELFKVIALGRNFDGPLLGFTMVDRRYRL